MFYFIGRFLFHILTLPSIIVIYFPLRWFYLFIILNLTTLFHLITFINSPLRIYRYFDKSFYENSEIIVSDNEDDLNTNTILSRFISKLELINYLNYLYQIKSDILTVFLLQHYLFDRYISHAPFCVLKKFNNASFCVLKNFNKNPSPGYLSPGYSFKKFNNNPSPGYSFKSVKLQKFDTFQSYLQKRDELLNLEMDDVVRKQKRDELLNLEMDDVVRKQKRNEIDLEMVKKQSVIKKSFKGRRGLSRQNSDLIKIKNQLNCENVIKEGKRIDKEGKRIDDIGERIDISSDESSYSSWSIKKSNKIKKGKETSKRYNSRKFDFTTAKKKVSEMINSDPNVKAIGRFKEKEDDNTMSYKIEDDNTMSFKEKVEKVNNNTMSFKGDDNIKVMNQVGCPYFNTVETKRLTNTKVPEKKNYRIFPKVITTEAENKLLEVSELKYPIMKNFYLDPLMKQPLLNSQFNVNNQTRIKIKLPSKSSNFKVRIIDEKNNDIMEKNQDDIKNQDIKNQDIKNQDITSPSLTIIKSIKSSDYEYILKVSQEILKVFPREGYDDGSLAPIILRLCWHCCATYNKWENKGGSNGATMRFLPEIIDDGNTGLEIARASLEPIKQKFPKISYSDLWTLSGKLAIEYMGGPKIFWKCGRFDCLNDLHVPKNGSLPFGDKDANHIRTTFERMGFNDQEMVALVGAHSMGRCHKKYSGWEGKWTNTPTKFSNDFYKVLVNDCWNLSPVPETGKLQYYNYDKSLIMLITDMELIRDVNFYKWVRIYADNEAVFFGHFSHAFSKLLELGITRDELDNVIPRF